jgi:divalent metal cation (Fe/Co/Zn/Cd) transporter
VPVDGSGIFVAIAINLAYTFINGAILLRYLRQRHSDPSPLVSSQIRLFIDKLTSNILVLVSLGAAVLWRDTSFGRFIDPMASLLIGASMIFWSSRIMRDSIRELVDAACNEEVKTTILSTLTHHEEAYDDLIALRTRQAGGIVHIEVELGFAPHVPIGSIDRLRHELTAALHGFLPDCFLKVIPVAR